MGSTTSIGGPPIALVYQSRSGSEIRGTLSGYFSISASITAIMLFSRGQIQTYNLLAALPMIAGCFAGFYLSCHTTHRMTPRYTRQIVLVMATVAGIILLVKGISSAV